MTKLGGSPVPKHQTDETLSQNNPVSTTFYEAFSTKKNVRILSAAFRTGATTAGTVSRMDVKMTIDGVEINAPLVPPTANTWYYLHPQPSSVNMELNSNNPALYRDMLIEGKSIKIEVKVTWTVQPDPLEARIVYQKW